MADEQTLDAYRRKIEDYRTFSKTDGIPRDLVRLKELVNPGAHVLDLGCGPGDHAAWMRKNGFHVDPVDASPDMVAAANDVHDLSARVATFDDLDAEEKYDAVWASFSLLHAPKSEFPKHIRAIHRALLVGGILFLGLKSGSEERRDHLGRFYSFYEEDELRRLLDEGGFDWLEHRSGRSAGLAGTVDPWIALFARRA